MDSAEPFTPTLTKSEKYFHLKPKQTFSKINPHCDEKRELMILNVIINCHFIKRYNRFGQPQALNGQAPTRRLVGGTVAPTPGVKASIANFILQYCDSTWRNFPNLLVNICITVT